MLKLSFSARPTSLISFCVPAILAAVIAVTAPGSANAAGGSWGGSGGFGLGSGLAGGSWGGSGGGLFGGRRPIRNLLGRVASGIGNISLGSRGGSFGGSGGGSLGGFRGGSLGGFRGSSRGGLFGGSFGGRSFAGSTGGWSGGSLVSTDSFAGGSSGSAFASWGADSFSSLSGSVDCVSADLAAPVYATPAYATPIAAQSYVDTSFVDASFVDTSFASAGFAGCPTCAASAGPSFPIDQGFSETSFSSDTGFYDGSLPNYDGVPVDGGQVIDDGQLIDDDSLYDPGISAPTDYYNGGDNLLDDSGFPPPPGPAGDDTTRSRLKRSPTIKPAVLSLALPADAEVYINGRLTKTEGSVRNYVARKLKVGKEHSYQVKAVINRDGKRLVRSQTVRMKRGVTRTVALDFDKPVTTALALKVPADATVRLCGAETSATGERRFFETSKLQDGDAWENYEIEVAINRDGKEVVARKSLKLHAGDSQSIVFNFHDETGELVAVK